MAELEVAADLEHQQDQADLAEDQHGRRGVGGEDLGREIGPQEAQERRPQQQAGHDLADGARLPHRPRHASRHPREQDDDDELQQRRDDCVLDRLYRCIQTTPDDWRIIRERLHP